MNPRFIAGWPEVLSGPGLVIGIRKSGQLCETEPLNLWDLMLTPGKY